MEGKTNEDTTEFLQELKSQAASSRARGENASSTWVDPSDGTVYQWDVEKQGWFPKVDEDFIAAYQMNYGFTAPEDKPEEKSSSSVDTATTKDGQGTQPVDTAAESSKEKEKAETQAADEKGKKRKAKEEPAWFDMEQSRNTNVYVSGLPLDIDEEEFGDLMLKCGIIMEDPDTNKLKVKLYKDENGKPKGDGRCCYLKVPCNTKKEPFHQIESVDLAIELLDESDYRGHTIHVEQAEFHMKGEFNPSLKRKKKNKKKKKPGKGQEKLLDWVDRDVRKPKNERVVVIKNMFDFKVFEREPQQILELRNDLRSECEKYGDVRKVMVFDRNPEGICSVAFKEHESADACITVMNGRWFAGRMLQASRWDGVTNFNVQESEKDLQDRMKNWEKYLYGEEDEPASTTVTPSATTTTTTKS